MDGAITWSIAHPLEAVGALVVICAAVCLILVPGIWEATRHGSPRC